jgi:hypothetical protein
VIQQLNPLPHIYVLRNPVVSPPLSLFSVTIILERPTFPKLLSLDVSRRTLQSDSFGGGYYSVFGGESLEGVVSDEEFL